MGVDIEQHLKNEPAIIDDDEYWAHLANDMSAQMLPDFQNAMWTGVQAGERAMGFAVSWDLINEDVLRYTHRYAFDLIDPDGDMSIVAHTRQQVQSAFVDWQLGKLGDEGFPDLVRELEPLFGHMRANRIAATEATRLFAEGNLTAWRRSDVVTHKIWKTAVDDWVCLRCRPLHNVEVPLNQKFRDEVGGVDVDGPPLHVNCRCWVTGVVRGEELPAEGEAPTEPRYTPGGKPVGGALKIPKSGKYRPMYQQTLDAIDSVHGDGDLPEIPVKTKSKMSSRNGSYRFYTRYSNQANVAESIEINGKMAQVESVLAHEIGHFLDHQTIDGKGFSSTRAAFGDPSSLTGWWDAVKNSQAYHTLRDKKTNPQNHTRTIAISPERTYTVRPDAKFMSYLLSPEELWARSYTQYIAEKSGNPILLDQMDKDRQSKIHSDQQWAPEDFEPIKQAIDKVFLALGWLK